MLLDVKRKLFAKSDRVKSTDFHPTEPWLITGLYNGSVNLYHVETGALLKTFEVAEVPVRCVKFIARKNWFVAGSDDFQMRCFNYNTHEKVTAFEAHPDYIRCLTVHPTLSLVLTGSDDMTIKAWDWEKGWKCSQVYEGHTHYIMNIAINPKDSNTFASACLDRTVKIWSFGSAQPNFTLDAHEKGVNYVEYYHGGEKPYLVTTGDDRLVKVWDYHSKSCIQTLEGHSSNVSFAIFHPSLPIIISGSEDGTIKIWHANTYRLENTLNYALERAWCVAYRKGLNDVAIGFDEGVVVLQLGQEEPSFSMDSAGKLVYARNQEVLTVNLQTLADQSSGPPPPDGQKIALQIRELGSTEVFASSIQHSPNGRFVTVCGDGEYIIYTALAWRNKAFGQGSSFAWAGDSNTYAVLEGNSRVKVFKNFKEKTGTGLKGSGGWAVQGLHGGPLLAARGTGFVIFWDWETGEVVRRVEAEAKDIIWSASGNLVCITSEDSFYVLRFDRDAYSTALDSGLDLGDEGVEEAFDMVAEVPEGVKTAKWIGDCFIYTNAANRLNYLVGQQPHTVTQFDNALYLLGYIPALNRIYAVDKQMNIYGFTLSLTLVEYQTAVLRGDLEAAQELLPSIPADQRNKVARFLEAQGQKQLAMDVSTDPDHRFDLAIQLDDLDTALSIARATPDPESESKWKAAGDKALATWKFGVAKTCYESAGDVSALLLLHLASGDRQGLQKLALEAEKKGQNNIAFASLLQLGNASACVDILVKTDRAPEAALFARTYAPSLVTKATHAWKAELEAKKRVRLASTIADPSENPEAFEEGWEEALALEAEHGHKANGIFKT